jgi:hypothetical protein
MLEVNPSTRSRSGASPALPATFVAAHGGPRGSRQKSATGPCFPGISARLLSFRVAFRSLFVASTMPKSPAVPTLRSDHESVSIRRHLSCPQPSPSLGNKTIAKIGDLYTLYDCKSQEQFLLCPHAIHSELEPRRRELESCAGAWSATKYRKPASGQCSTIPCGDNGSGSSSLGRELQKYQDGFLRGPIGPSFAAGKPLASKRAHLYTPPLPRSSDR